MYLLYSLALTALFLALLPYFIYQAARHGKYLGSFYERLGWLPDSIKSDARPTIWVHAVSVGEFNAARPLIAKIRKRYPDHRIVVSTTTMTGQRLAREQAGRSFDAAFYFPFDWSWTARRALNRVNPRAVIILETELWPNFLRECRRRGTKVILINGRISPRSYSRYLKARRFIARVMSDLSLIVMQSEADRERALLLGAPRDRMRVCGNLKYDFSLDERRDHLDSLCAEIADQFALSASDHLIVAGSTAAGEEKLLLDALKDIRREDGLEKTRMLVAPRHPERFEEVARLIEGSGFGFARRSEKRGSQADVILLDSIGELASVYRFASVVFVGGSLAPVGGHNIIEPAAYRKPIIVGPHTFNFRQIVADFRAADALVEVESNELAEAMIQLLTDRNQAQDKGERAQAIIERNRGATLCALAAIEEIIGDR
ncbi:MAG: 3-deoxy-D-manno-octulosonic acid transferase [Acidobacteriota bacterium]